MPDRSGHTVLRHAYYLDQPPALQSGQRGTGARVEHMTLAQLLLDLRGLGRRSPVACQRRACALWLSWSIVNGTSR